MLARPTLNLSRVSRSLTRQLHASASLRNLVGPPDPVSNLRPVIYDDVLPASSQSNVRHPYSLTEFGTETATKEYQWKMHRQQLDAFNHEFWVDSNLRFENAKQAILDSIPDSTTSEERERSLSDFYSKWMAQESARQREYSSEMRKQTWANIILNAKAKWEVMRSRLAGSASKP